MSDETTSNEAIEGLLNANPLLAFSVYTHLQSEILDKLGTEILQILDASIKETHVEGVAFQEVYGKTWLWVLGTYEVVRTMTGNRGAECFSDRTIRELEELKRELAHLRIPFAKQELKGKSQVVSGEPSIAGINKAKRDFSFHINNRDIYMRPLIEKFRTVLSNISRTDVLKDLREAYQP